VLPTLYPETHVDTIRRRGTIFVGVEESPFCAARAPSDRPSCSFYASTIASFLQLLELHPAVRVSRCRSAGSKSCLLMVLPVQPRTAGAESVLLDLADEFMATPLPESVPTVAAALETETPTEAATEAPSEAPLEAPLDAPTEAAQIETALAVEPAESSEPAPPAGTSSLVEAASEAVAPVATPQPETTPAEEIPPPIASPADAPHTLAGRWTAIAAHRTTPHRPNVEALFAGATRPEEDVEAPWHRL
jgi:hypothetical protein